jgi:hypothetical protein
MADFFPSNFFPSNFFPTGFFDGTVSQIPPSASAGYDYPLSARITKNVYRATFTKTVYSAVLDQ